MLKLLLALGLSALLHLTSFLATASSIETTSTHILVSAIVGKNDASAFECWKVEPPFAISSQTGLVGAKLQPIGAIEGGSIVFFSQSSVTNAGLHNSPSPQWVAILQANGTVVLPTTKQTLALPSGGLIVAQDTADVSQLGHDTFWAPGAIAMQLPFKNGFVNHTFVHDGPCSAFDTQGRD